MYRQDRRELFKQTLSEWGVEEQMRILEEELAECIVAASHYIRKRPGARFELQEELADAYIIVGQIIEYIGSDFVEEMVDYKLAKVREELDGNKRD